MSNLHLKSNPTLTDLQAYVEQMVHERGFKDTIPDKMMMLTEEVGELSKALRKQVGLKLGDDTVAQNAGHEAADILNPFQISAPTKITHSWPKPAQSASPYLWVCFLSLNNFWHNTGAILGRREI